MGKDINKEHVCILSCEQKPVSLIGDKKSIICTQTIALAVLSVKAQKCDEEPSLTG